MCKHSATPLLGLDFVAWVLELVSGVSAVQELV
jgi:hypothetical protein